MQAFLFLRSPLLIPQLIFYGYFPVLQEVESGLGVM